MKTTVGIIFGCPSVEHEVAVISALQAMDALDTEKYELVPLYISKGGDWYTGAALRDLESYKDMKNLLLSCEKVLPSLAAKDGTIFLYPEGFRNKKPLARIDVFLPVMHGAYGEDGCLQGLLEMTQLPYTGPGALAAAVGMDKIAQKALCRMGGIPVLDCFWFYSSEWAQREAELIDCIENKFHYPVIVKPANTGSSIGIKIAADRLQLTENIELATRYSMKVLVEPAITNLKEINVAVLGDGEAARTSALEEPLSYDEILSFSDKYLSGGSKESGGMASLKRRLPAELPDAMAERIREMALDAFYCLNGSGVWRMDFMIDQAEDRIYLNEVNTIPGSLSYYLWEPLGMSYRELLDQLIAIALKSRRKRENIISTFESNILQQGGFKGKK